MRSPLRATASDRTLLMPEVARHGGLMLIFGLDGVGESAAPGDGGAGSSSQKKLVTGGALRALGH